MHKGQLGISRRKFHQKRSENRRGKRDIMQINAIIYLRVALQQRQKLLSARHLPVAVKRYRMALVEEIAQNSSVGSGEFDRKRAGK
jgi:hypothetical protein